ncbi:MAG TPA: AraC family transcriptional regulator [Puia sp.]|jgi:AraC-like DNA-binding protein|nr:AraC family transcriptional regulator [Puia sp.]
MPVSFPLQKIGLTPVSQLRTLTEHLRTFNLKNCELIIFECYEESYQIPLVFADFVITSMIRGKKIMRLDGLPTFEYLPAETVIIPANKSMSIDFPEASFINPTQCIALKIDNALIRDTLHYLNTNFNTDEEEPNEWMLHIDQYHFNNDAAVTDLIDKLTRICTGPDKTKDIYADLSVRELLVRIAQNQHLQHQANGAPQNSNNSRLHFVLQYIHDHLTERIEVDTLSRKAYLSRNIFFKWFKEQFGITPLEYITRERIRLARELLATEKYSITQISLQCGFTDVNYFVRTFKKSEGLTPGAYRDILRKVP